MLASESCLPQQLKNKMFLLADILNFQQWYRWTESVQFSEPESLN